MPGYLQNICLGLIEFADPFIRNETNNNSKARLRAFVLLFFHEDEYGVHDLKHLQGTDGWQQESVTRDVS